NNEALHRLSPWVLAPDVRDPLNHSIAPVLAIVDQFFSPYYQDLCNLHNLPICVTARPGRTEGPV
ncbi:MAG TPA: hypothetical protein VJY33_22030, partial [Isosphaeraceae bacterium]|nr:hypothetical protein [Isosphaeraceae bacterium]